MLCHLSENTVMCDQLLTLATHTRSHAQTHLHSHIGTRNTFLFSGPSFCGHSEDGVGVHVRIFIRRSRCASATISISLNRANSKPKHRVIAESHGYSAHGQDLCVSPFIATNGCNEGKRGSRTNTYPSPPAFTAFLSFHPIFLFSRHSPFFFAFHLI